MNRIGLLTFSSNLNYGSWCLTWALFAAIRDMGFDIEIIDYHYAECDKDEERTIRDLIRILICWDGRRDDLIEFFSKIKVKKGIERERKEYWNISKKRYSPSNIAEANGVYDVFLIGADQVWDHRFAGDSTAFFLDFVVRGKKIAFAAGSGYTKLSFGKREREEFAKYLTCFDYIAVREDGLKELLKDSCNLNVPVVCDPTMLIRNSEWLEFVKENREKKPYVLLYIVDKGRMFELARHYARKHGFEIIYIGYDQPVRYVETRQPEKVADWLSLIYYAEKVFTGSYHGLLFSIYFKKEFAYYRRRPLDRFAQLSEKLLIDEYEIHHKEFDVEKRIVWGRVKKAEAEYREFSLGVLKDELDAIKE